MIYSVLSTLYVSVLKGFHQNWTEQTTSHNEWHFVKGVDKKKFIYWLKDIAILGMQLHLAIFYGPQELESAQNEGVELCRACAWHLRLCQLC